ncbi:AcrR family transcriptional regulator [Mumia flava]|uniref:AcrR family transcriptional regulator n=1 Tax=Mumia flava TaxID=1348852 RepID=A0A2M9BIB7_9ACTN|nr:TetR/AcrR family transcriptional regulator [Mumia flava]PJJ57690.1 AcrR family transcriptional regulator [Mumia flava]
MPQWINEGSGPAPGGRTGGVIGEDQILDAAFDLLVDRGIRRMTMSDVGRQAGVSRATLYRRWGSVNDVVGALLTREFAQAAAETVPGAGDGRHRLVSAVVAMVRLIRTHPVLRKIVEVDPDYLVPYLLQRLGTSTRDHLALVEEGIRAGIADGSIGPGDPADRARSVLLTAMAFCLSGPVVAETGAQDHALDRLDEQLGVMLDRYLAP